MSLVTIVIGSCPLDRLDPAPGQSRFLSPGPALGRAAEVGGKYLWVNPGCRMRLRRRSAAFAKLKNLAAVARIVGGGPLAPHGLNPDL
jgi:hypothetical protein